MTPAAPEATFNPIVSSRPQSKLPLRRRVVPTQETDTQLHPVDTAQGLLLHARTDGWRRAHFSPKATHPRGNARREEAGRRRTPLDYPDRHVQSLGGRQVPEHLFRRRSPPMPEGAPRRTHQDGPHRVLLVSRAPQARTLLLHPRSLPLLPRHPPRLVVRVKIWNSLAPND